MTKLVIHARDGILISFRKKKLLVTTAKKPKGKIVARNPFSEVNDIVLDRSVRRIRVSKRSLERYLKETKDLEKRYEFFKTVPIKKFLGITIESEYIIKWKAIQAEDFKKYGILKIASKEFKIRL